MPRRERSPRPARARQAPPKQEIAAARAAAAAAAAARDEAAYWPSVEGWLLSAAPGQVIDLPDASVVGLARLAERACAVGMPTRVVGCSLVAVAEGRGE